MEMATKIQKSMRARRARADMIMLKEERQRRIDMLLIKLQAAVRGVVLRLVESFGSRGTEPFELFRSEFGQNSVRIKEILGGSLKCGKRVLLEFTLEVQKKTQLAEILRSERCKSM